MNVRKRLVDLVAAQDPGHARLTTATAITGGMLGGAGFGQFVITSFHADAGLLAMAIFLSMQAGSMVKDPTPRARLVTTALLLPAVIVAILVASALSAHRPVLIAVFVVITGAATWMRRFGARTGALGSLIFMGYFFTLFMKPAADSLAAFCLVAAGAVAAQLVVRAVLTLRRPRRQLDVLLRELRTGSVAAFRAASRPHPAALRSALARLDGVGRAITGWQDSFHTSRHVNVDEQTLAEQVLDARVDTEEACLQRTRPSKSPRAASAMRTDSVDRAEGAFFAVLAEHTTLKRIHAARDVATEIIDRPDSELEPYLIARSAASHARLRDIEFPRENVRPSSTAGGLPALPGAEYRATTVQPQPHARALPPSGAPARPGDSHRWRWVSWRSWQPTSRMAVQVMTAASVACVVGESISASRWYWAVMTAFVIFVGATTRGSILTRAYRRVAGTAVGIVIGLAVVTLAGGETAILIGICGIAVFGMLYFGPLNYLYSAVFTTTMLVSLYRMLGVLDGGLLELRLVETLSGAIIGVLCAYLILSTSSRPTLVAKADSYFDALDQLLSAVLEQLTASASPGQRSDPTDLVSRLRALETAQMQLDQTVTAMSIAFITDGPRRETDAVHLMYIVTRAAARVAQAVLGASHSTDEQAATNPAFTKAVGEVRREAQSVRLMLLGEGIGSAERDGDPAASPQPLVVENLRNLPSTNWQVRDAILALARIDWALRQVVQSSAPNARPARALGSERPPG